MVAGLDELPRSSTDYALLVQCVGWMVTRKQLHNRLKPAIDAGIPVNNYGMTIAYTNVIFKRAVEPFLWRKIWLEVGVKFWKGFLLNVKPYGLFGRIAQFVYGLNGYCGNLFRLESG